MTNLLQNCLSLVTSIVGAFATWLFETPYPGLLVSFGAVMIGWLMISLGWDYLDFFLHTESHVRENKK